MRKKSLILTLGTATLMMTGCAPVVFMGGATAVVTAASEERSIGGVLSDTEIKARIQYLLLNHSPDAFNSVNVVVRQSRVLLTGLVNKKQDQIDAVRFAWQAKGVKEVVDEIMTQGEGGFKNYAKDGWITTQLKSKLLAENDVRSLNYDVHTVGGVVYIMGIAQSQDELNLVVSIARRIAGVQHVKSFVTLKDNAPSPSPATPPKDEDYVPSFKRGEQDAGPQKPDSVPEDSAFDD